MENNYKIYKAHRGWGLQYPSGLVKIYATKKEAELARATEIATEVNQWATSYTAQQ